MTSRRTVEQLIARLELIDPEGAKEEREKFIRVYGGETDAQFHNRIARELNDITEKYGQKPRSQRRTWRETFDKLTGR